MAARGGGAALVAARGRRRSLLADPALLLVLGGALLVPAMSKYGASWNYALPALPALAVVAGAVARLAPAGPPRTPRTRRSPASSSPFALVLALTRVFPLPVDADARAPRALYSYVKRPRGRVRRTDPRVAPRPAYFLVGQPVEIEGSSYPHLAAAGIPGTEKVLDRLQRRVHAPPGDLALAQTGLPEAIERPTSTRRCNLRYYFGAVPVHAFSRRDVFRRSSPLRRRPAVDPRSDARRHEPRPRRPHSPRAAASLLSSPPIS